jgi:hypothetical protein
MGSGSKGKRRDFWVVVAMVLPMPARVGLSAGLDRLDELQGDLLSSALITEELQPLCQAQAMDLTDLGFIAATDDHPAA